MEPRVLHLSLVAGGALLDRSGGRLGRVDDLIVRLGDEEYPPVTGLLAAVAGRQVFVPADQVDDVGQRLTTLRVPRLDLRPFERRPQEVLLKQEVLDRQLINIDGARLVRANEIEVARLDGWWRVVGVDTGLRGLVRRLLPRALAGRIATGGFLDWASVEPFTGHVPTVRLRVPHPKLARLHPAELADVVSELPEERREAVLALLPGTQRRRVRALLGYDPATVGGLMSPELVCLFSQATAAEAIDRVRGSRVSPTCCAPPRTRRSASSPDPSARCAPTPRPRRSRA